MAFVVELVDKLASLSKQKPLSSRQRGILQSALALLRDIASRGDDGRGLAGGASLVAGIQQAGHIPLLLAMLQALRPIQLPRNEEQQTGMGAGGAPPSSQDMGAAMSVLQHAAQLPWEAPYPGYRTDILAVLANLLFQRPVVQQEVQGLGGVLLVLAQCQVDRGSPLAREWALWAVRNLCEGSEQAQQAIRELQLCATVDSAELQQMGVQLQLDALTGKPRLVQRAGPGR